MRPHGWRHFLFQTKGSTRAPLNEIKKELFLFPHIGVFDVCFSAHVFVVHFGRYIPRSKMLKHLFCKGVERKRRFLAWQRPLLATPE